MKNFIFKSSPDLHKMLFNKLEMILTENRHQRSDLALIIRYMKSMKNQLDLQKQVDEFFEEKPEDIPEENDSSSSRTE